LAPFGGLAAKALRREGFFLYGFVVSRRVAKALGFLPCALFSSENCCPSPDSSGNPFAFSFKKQKIGTDSGK